MIKISGLVKSEGFQPTIGRIDSTVDTTINSGTPADITGATVTFTVLVASYLWVMASFDIDPATINNIFVGYLNVDGANQTQQVVKGAPTAGNNRAVCAQSWLISLAAGSHTIKLQGSRASGAGSATFAKPHTGFTYMLVAQ